MRKKIVIVGASAAGYGAAITLSRYPHHDITLIDQQPHNSINICRLSHYIASTITESDLYLPSPPFTYQSKTALIGIDAAAGTAYCLQQGRTITLPYDQLLITTGTAAISLENPPNRSNITSQFHTLSDAREIQKVITLGKKIIIIGGGINGIELAAALINRGIKPIIIERADRILPKICPDTAITVSKWLISRGATIFVNTTELPDSFIDYHVITAVGIKPSPIISSLPGKKSTTGELIVTPYGETSVDHQFAAGDCTAIEYETGLVYSRYRWIDAFRHGSATADTMAGNKNFYQQLSTPATRSIGPFTIQWENEK